MAPTSPARLDATRLARAFDLVAGQISGGRAAYAALAVARGDGFVRSEAFLAGERLEAPRRSAIASITKPITATAILQLVEAGALVLTEPLSTYLPDFRPQLPSGSTAGEPITAWHVLTHTAGLTDATDEFFLAGSPTPAAMVERLSRDALRFPPGTAYAYTSDSYYLLAELVARLSGIPYPDYLRHRVFAPLGMSATTFDPMDAGPAALGLEGSIGPPGLPYDALLAGFVSLAMPGGGLWSTADDIARFGRALLLGGTVDGTRVLGRPFVELMTRLQTEGILELDTGRPPIYALGWGRPGLGRGSPASPAAFGHTGATGSVLIVDPSVDLVVVYLRNEWSAPMTTADEAVQAVYAALD
jgi:CubicO group peptidase (beta-lactamase class C family)